MIFISCLFFTVLTLVAFIYLCEKNKFLLNFSGNNHQKFTSSKNIPLVGGPILLGFFLLFIDISILFKFSIFLIFIIGFFSDLNFLTSAKNKLIYLFITVFSGLYFMEVVVDSTRIDILDYFLDHKIFAILFSSFCILIIVNGTNFIDGNNTNVIGYYLVVTLTLLVLSDQGYQVIDKIYIFLIIECLLILYLFNLFNKIYIGDSGSFLLGFFYSVLLIKLYNFNNSISPFFIILILWYPGFENLFSIIRKFSTSRKPTEPDNNHFHQLVFYYLKKKLDLRTNFLNSFVGILITFYNFVIMFVSVQNLKNTKLMILLIFINVLIYFYIYFKLFKFREKN